MIRGGRIAGGPFSVFFTMSGVRGVRQSVEGRA